MILVVSDKKFYIESLAHVLKRQGYKDIFYSPPVFENILSKCNDSATVIIDIGLNDYSSVLGIVRKLRCDINLKFKGKVIVLSFEPLEQLKKTSEGEVLETKGIELLPIPFCISKLKELVDSAVQVLLEEEWKRVSKQLRVGIIVKMAHDIGHKYGNIFALALASLHEIEILSYYGKALDLKKLKEELDSVQRLLTREKLDGFFGELQTVIDEIKTYKCQNEYNSKMKGVQNNFDYICRYLSIIKLLDNNFVESPQGIFADSKEVRKIIENNLEFLNEVQNKFSREKRYE